MVTQLIFKFCFFVALFSILFCLVTGVSFGESLFRGLVVFAGSYFISIVFFVCVRVILTLKPKLSVEPTPEKEGDSEQRGSG